uniref:Uncharacterized protein n=1 Tax=Anopheles farauti TaxID=69004 RepID=A0A182Q779_9DIPT
MICRMRLLMVSSPVKPDDRTTAGDVAGVGGCSSVVGRLHSVLYRALSRLWTRYFVCSDFRCFSNRCTGTGGGVPLLTGLLVAHAPYLFFASALILMSESLMYCSLAPTVVLHSVALGALVPKPFPPRGPPPGLRHSQIAGPGKPQLAESSLLGKHRSCAGISSISIRNMQKVYLRCKLQRAALSTGGGGGGWMGGGWCGENRGSATVQCALVKSATTRATPQISQTELMCMGQTSFSVASTEFGNSMSWIDFMNASKLQEMMLVSPENFSSDMRCCIHSWCEYGSSPPSSAVSWLRHTYSYSSSSVAHTITRKRNSSLKNLLLTSEIAFCRKPAGRITNTKCTIAGNSATSATLNGSSAELTLVAEFMVSRIKEPFDDTCPLVVMSELQLPKEI